MKTRVHHVCFSVRYLGSRSSPNCTKAPVWHQHVRELPNAAYFMSEEKPQDFDHVKYLTALDPASDDRRGVSSIWRDKVVAVFSNLAICLNSGKLAIVCLESGLLKNRLARISGLV